MYKGFLFYFLTLTIIFMCSHIKASKKRLKEVSKPLIATEDITVYKVLRVTESGKYTAQINLSSLRM